MFHGGGLVMSHDCLFRGKINIVVFLNDITYFRVVFVNTYLPSL